MLKAVGIILLIFFAFVAFHFLYTAAASLLPPLPGPEYSPVTDTGELTSINVDLFTKNGAGRSIITQGYGVTPYSYLYPDDWHDGIDIAASYGAAVYSPNDGTVLVVGNQDNYCYHKAFGKYVAVEDPINGLVLWYAHLGTQTVSPGQLITKGAEIGTIGTTGLETGTHLHFSIFKAAGFTMTPRDGCGPEPTGRDVDPLNYLGTTYQ